MPAEYSANPDQMLRDSEGLTDIAGKCEEIGKGVASYWESARAFAGEDDTGKTFLDVADPEVRGSANGMIGVGKSFTGLAHGVTNSATTINGANQAGAESVPRITRR